MIVPAQLAVGQLRTGIALIEDAFELGVLQLDQAQGVVNAFANVRLFGGGAEGLPSGTAWSPWGTQNTLASR